MSKQIQNFYKSTILLDWTVGTGNFYVTTKPTITDGWLVVSPNNTALREIVKYTNTGTDANGDYITISERGVGGTSEQTHSLGEPIRMNITAEYWKNMNDAIDAIVAGAAPDADTDTKGLVEIATDAEVIAGTDTGSTGAKLVATPSQLKENYEKITPIVRTYLTASSPATWTKPAGLKYIEVEVQAGGAGSNGTDSDLEREATNGGGAGGYSKKLILASNLGDTVTVTIGAGGAAGIGGTTTTPAGAGETSSFGSHCSATGGNGIVPGVGSGGDINCKGGGGANGTTVGSSGEGSILSGGVGGSSVLGGGGQSPGGVGVDGGLYGGGAGGATGQNNGNNGGKGGDGIVIVKEFY